MIREKVFRWGRIVFLAIALAVSSLPYAVPVGATTTTFVTTAGVYTVTCDLAEQVLDGTTGIVRAHDGTLTITTANVGIVSSATLAIGNVGTVAVTGHVGVGASPKISLVGSAGGIHVILNGRVTSVDGVATRISGHIEGYIDTSGAAGMSGAAGSIVAAETGDASILITAGAQAGSKYVQWVPQRGIRLSDLDNVVATKWGLWNNLQVSQSGGPQLELRFTSRDCVDPEAAGHVDVTLLAPVTGTGLWVHKTYDQNSTAMYYGNDPVDGTTIYNDAPAALSTIVEAINDESVMVGHDNATASNWILTRVRVELWDAGVRTCYVDDVMINGRVNTFEAAQLSGNFAARPSS